jgi:hypothetical protein
MILEEQGKRPFYILKSIKMNRMPINPRMRKIKNKNQKKIYCSKNNKR